MEDMNVSLLNNVTLFYHYSIITLNTGLATGDHIKPVLPSWSSFTTKPCLDQNVSLLAH